MNPDVLALLPLVAPVATLVIVVIGVLFSNHHVDSRLGDFSRHMDARFSDMTKLITAESARLEAVLKLDIERVVNRVAALENREGVIVRPRG